MGKRTRYCPHGHDKDEVGRGSGGSCLECNRIRNRAYEPSPERVRQRNERARRRHQEREGKSSPSETCEVCGASGLTPRGMMTHYRLAHGTTLQHCMRGHDLTWSQVARQRTCVACTEERRISRCRETAKREGRVYKPRRKPNATECLKGHDLTLPRALAGSHCRECLYEWQRSANARYSREILAKAKAYDALMEAMNAELEGQLVEGL